ncbi:MAG: hypothetical protein HC917_15790 [Richelia sp. SM2_1_7]|nr:hypothetical protein [Richelia sp. SM2_1_7]
MRQYKEDDCYSDCNSSNERRSVNVILDCSITNILSFCGYPYYLLSQINLGTIARKRAKQRVERYKDYDVYATTIYEKTFARE